MEIDEIELECPNLKGFQWLPQANEFEKFGLSSMNWLLVIVRFKDIELSRKRVPRHD